MKKLIVVAVMLVIAGCAGMQPAPDANQPIEFVLNAPGKTQAQLFSSTKSWIAETFVSAKAVIDDADKDAGRIIAKGRIAKPCSGLQCAMESGWMIGFTMRIDMKDGKFRTTYTNPMIIEPPTSGSLVGMTYVAGSPESERPVKFAGDFTSTKAAFQNLSESLQQYLVSDSSNKNF